MPAGWSSRASRDQLSRQISATERALAESIERYRSLFAYSPHAAFSLDLEGVFTDANQVAQDLSGYSLEDLRGLHFSDLIAEENIQGTVDAFLGALRREPQQLEATMVARDGRRMELNLAAVPVIVGDEVVGVHGTAEDVTENNELRRELERARAEAVAADAAKTLFLANMSHEVRTPLTSLLGATEMLAEGDLGPSERRLVEIMHRAGGRLLRLVNDILDVSRLGAGTLDVQVREFRLRDAVQEASAFARPLALVEDLTFELELADDLPDRVTGDAMRIGQVLTNLIGNALKFTEQGGVRLGVDVADRTGGTVEVRFTVEDTGIGMLGDQLPTLFQSFTQADTSTTRKYGGAGLGLAISRELVTLMGGTIEASSVAGRGSTFVVTLPLGVPPEDEPGAPVST